MARARPKRVTGPDRIEAQALSSLSQFQQRRRLRLSCHDALPRRGSKYPMRMDMVFSAPIGNAVCLKRTGHNILLGRANPTNGIFGNHRSEDTPLPRSLPRAQCYQAIESHPVALQAVAECALARAKCPLGRNADVIDAGLPWRRLDALDQLRHLALECVSAGPQRSGRKATNR